MQNERRKGADIEGRLLEVAVRVGKAFDALPDTRLGRHIAGQLVRSGTSPAPNYAEACAAESKKYFIHKLGMGAFPFCAPSKVPLCDGDLIVSIAW